jgi:hypothetical protein
MHQALIDAATKTALVLPEPMPFVLQTSLDDFYVSYQINAYVKQAVIYSNLIKIFKMFAMKEELKSCRPIIGLQETETKSRFLKII